MAEPTADRRHRFALVTGASGGIGYELARLLAKDRHDLAIVARSGALLDRTARELEADFGVEVRPLPLDLADPQAPDRLYGWVEAGGRPVDVLVNNAGFGSCGPFTATDLGVELGMLQVNVVALTHLTKLIGRSMAGHGRGRILNVASTAAFQPGPWMAVYFASKAYVLSFSEALAEELRGTGVTVTVLAPGPTRTGFQSRAGMEEALIGRGRLMADARCVAAAGYQGMMAGKRLVIPGLANRAGALFTRFVPRTLLTRIVSAATRSRSR